MAKLPKSGRSPIPSGPDYLRLPNKNYIEYSGFSSIYVFDEAAYDPLADIRELLDMAKNFAEAGGKEKGWKKTSASGN